MQVSSFVCSLYVKSSRRSNELRAKQIGVTRAYLKKQRISKNPDTVFDPQLLI